MNVTPKLRYTLEFGADEYRLIVAALGESLSGDQLDAAETLKRKMVAERARILRQMSEQANQYERNLN